MIPGDICADCGGCPCSSFRGGRLSVGGGGEGGGDAAAAATTATAAALQIRKIIHVYMKRLNHIGRENPFSPPSLALRLSYPSFWRAPDDMLSFPALQSAEKGRHIWHEPRPTPRSLTPSRGLYLLLRDLVWHLHYACAKSSAKILTAFHFWPRRQLQQRGSLGSLWRRPSLSDTWVGKMEHFFSLMAVHLIERRRGRSW